MSVLSESDRTNAVAIATAVRSGELSARTVVDEALLAAQGASGLAAFRVIDSDGARAAAEHVDARRDAGEDPGPLAGVPITVKDNIAIAGLELTCGSRFLEGYRSPFTATAIERLRAAGAVVIGTTNCDEFAMGSSGEHSAFAATRNPWDLERVPGGSSSGSAAAVAGGLVPLALGSDTGGSVRQPAALAGVAGFKPTYGRVSRHGLVAFGSSLDQIGPLTRSVDDSALALEVMAGHDERDATSSTTPTTGIGDSAAGEVDPKGVFDGLRVGRLHTVDAGDSVAPAVDEAVDLAARGVVQVEETR